MRKKFVYISVVIIILLFGKWFVENILLQSDMNDLLYEWSSNEKTIFCASIVEIEDTCLKVIVEKDITDNDGLNNSVSVTISEDTIIRNMHGEKIGISDLFVGQKIRLCVGNMVRQFDVITNNIPDSVTVYLYCFEVDVIE